MRERETAARGLACPPPGDTSRMSTSSPARIVRSRNAHSQRDEPAAQDEESVAWRASWELRRVAFQRPCAIERAALVRPLRHAGCGFLRGLETASAAEHGLEKIGVLTQETRSQEVVAYARLRRLSEPPVVGIGEQLGHARTERGEVVRRDETARATVLDLVVDAADARREDGTAVPHRPPG